MPLRLSQRLQTRRLCVSCRVNACPVESAQPSDSFRIDGIGPRHVCTCLALSEPLERFLALMGGKLVRAPKFHSTGLRSLAALAPTSPDQLPLELRQPAKNGDH